MLPRSIRLDSTWGKRIVRVWIALFLPVAAICGFFALDQHMAPPYLINRERNVSEAIELVDAEIAEAKQNNKIIEYPGMEGKTTIIEGRIVRDGVYESNSEVIAELVERKSDWERARRRNHDERSKRRQARDQYIVLSILIAVTPAILLFFYRFIMWLWLGREEKA